MERHQFRGLVDETLTEAKLHCDNSEELLMLTAAVESDLGFLIEQLDDGPALGPFQMEPMTHDDIMFRWLNKPSRSELKNRIINYCRFIAGPILPEVMRWNLKYAILLARLKYMSCSSPIPDKNDIRALAQYWKTNYNSRLGDGTVEKAIAKYRKYVADKI